MIEQERKTPARPKHVVREALYVFGAPLENREDLKSAPPPPPRADVPFRFEVLADCVGKVEIPDLKLQEGKKDCFYLSS